MIYFGISIFVIYCIFRFLYIYFPLANKKQFVFGKETKTYHSFAILVPAYNEQDVVINCLKSLLNINYPNYSVYIINDGSTDDTLGVLENDLSLMPIRSKRPIGLKFEQVKSRYQSRNYKNVYVIDKENGGKADALNAGIACCREKYVVTLDADCMLRRDAILIMNDVFQDENVVAAGGTVHIIQSINSSSKVAKMMYKLKNIIKHQVMQYLTAFYLHKFTQSMFNALIVISGAYGAFKKDMLIHLGGYRKSVGEDMDITLKTHRYIKKSKSNYKMKYVPQSVCYTECPENFKNLTKQRIRWQKAFVDCVFVYGLKMFTHFKPAVSFFFIFDSLILGTVTAMMFFLIPLYIILHQHLSLLFILIFSMDFLIGVVERITTMVIAKRYNYQFSKIDYARIAMFIPFELITYRFLNILYVIMGIFSYFVNRNHWNKAERLGRSFSDTISGEMKNVS